MTPTKDEVAVRQSDEPRFRNPDEAIKDRKDRDEKVRKAREDAAPDAGVDTKITSTEFTGQHPLEHRQTEPKAKGWDEPPEGALDLTDPEGRKWAPIACGVHRSAPSNREPDGYQPDCEACKSELGSTLTSRERYGTF